MSPSFRFAGLRKPSTKPRISVARTPLWEQNRFSAVGSDLPDNDPIFNVSGDPPYPTPVTLATPAVTAKVNHLRLPGTAYVTHTADASMTWGINKCFAFKCYFQLDSVAGRVPIFSSRDSIDGGGPFIEVRDGHVVCGWYDVRLKREVYVSTSKAIVEPGYTYYLYYRKWFPRGWVSSVGGPKYKARGNWMNSIHAGNMGAADRQSAYDSLVVRRFPRARPAVNQYYDWCGYDAKAYAKLGSPAAFYDYFTNLSSYRACVSFVAADTDYGSIPSSIYSGPTRITPSGCVMFKVELDKANTAVDIVALNPAATDMRFVYDHVGMLLQIEDSSLVPPYGSTTFRIVEMISATKVRVIAESSAAPAFNFIGGNQYISVFPDVSLVKSEGYDESLEPDTGSYAIEAFGSSLAGDPLSGITQFSGKAWSFAWGMFTATAGNDSDGYPHRSPDIFEDASVSFAAGNRITSGCEIGTDVFGLQGSANPCDGSLPCNAVPAGELAVDATFARLAVDTRLYLPAVWPAGSPVDATAPASTQPNAGLAVTRDAASTSATDPVIQYTREVPPGERLMRVSFYDPDYDEESAPGDEVRFNIPEEDGINPSAKVELVLSGMPICTEPGRRVWRRIRMSLEGAAAYFVAKDVQDSDSYSATVQVDDVSMQSLSQPVTSAELFGRHGSPPRGRVVAISGGRLVVGGLDEAEGSIAYSAPGEYSSFPIANVLPIAAGDSSVRGLCDMLGSLIVFKRTAVLAYDLSGELPILKRQVLTDGCVSPLSIVGLEDRIYYMSDRGPMVLQSDLSPFFIGWRLKGLLESATRAGLENCAAGINRGRSQILMTSDVAGSPCHYGIEFQHPMDGEDTLRAELVAGHRFSNYDGVPITALASVQRPGVGFAVIAGTSDGFAAWVDAEGDGRVMAGTYLEGNRGSTYEDNVRPTIWSTREFTGMVELDKHMHFLDVSRPKGGTGLLTVDLYRDRGDYVGSINVDLSKPFSSEELGHLMQGVRTYRFSFGSDSGIVWELLDLTVRLQYVDSR